MFLSGAFDTIIFYRSTFISVPTFIQFYFASFSVYDD